MTDYIAAYGKPGHVYHSEANRVAGEFETNARVDAYGVVRWISSGNVPPQDILDLWAHLGFDFDMVASQVAHRADLDRFLAEYRKADALGPTDEERYEARAAHGPGVELVNVFTGRRWVT